MTSVWDRVGLIIETSSAGKSLDDLKREGNLSPPFARPNDKSKIPTQTDVTQLRFTQ